MFRFTILRYALVLPASDGFDICFRNLQRRYAACKIVLNTVRRMQRFIPTEYNTMTESRLRIESNQYECIVSYEISFSDIVCRLSESMRSVFCSSTHN